MSAWRILSVSAVLVAACTAPPERLMPSPVLYAGADDASAFGIAVPDRLAVPVLYATGREPEGTRRFAGGVEGPNYLALEAEVVRLGQAHVTIGEEEHWPTLWRESVAVERGEDPRLRLEGVEELAVLDLEWRDREEVVLHDAQRAFLSRLEEELARSSSRELLVYVHGAKVGFERCTVRTAELAHFLGRDFVPVVFDWPTHPNILAYVMGEDHERAHRSARSLRALLEFLAQHSSARRIHVVCYSAGGIVTSEALTALRRRSPEATSEELRDRHRLGAVVFNAADVALDTFLGELADMHDVLERLTLTRSDDDSALGMAEAVLGGGRRVGVEGPVGPVEQELLERLERVEFLDVSWDHEARGFDITGHHYWYRHPWVSSDLVLNLRGDLPAARRGLVPTDHPRIWALPEDYPDRVRRAAREHLSWGPPDGRPEGLAAPGAGR